MQEIIGVWIVYFLTAITPGPSTFLILHHSKHYGRARAVALGVTLSTLSWVLISTAGYCTVLNSNVIALYCLKTVGSIYFIFLAMQLANRFLNSKRSLPDAMKPLTDIAQGNIFKGFTEGIITGITNPNSALFFLTLMGPIICTGQTSILRQSICGLGIVSISLGWYQLLAWGISTDNIQGYLLRAERLIQPVLSIVCIAFAIRLWV